MVVFVRTPLELHALAEKRLSAHRRRAIPEKCLLGETCPFVKERNRAYAEYTKTPHPSTLGRGGSR